MNPNPRIQPDPRDTPSPLDSLDRVLNALNSTAPPTGMEQRILNAVELRVADQSSVQPVAHASRLLWLRSLRIAPTVAFAAAVALLALAFMPRFHTHSAVTPPKNTAASKAGPFLGPSLQLDPAAAHKIDPMPQPILASTGLPLPATPPSAHEAAKSKFFLVTASAPPPPVAATAAQASFPAPPMPLTEQEKLLLRLAHRNDPQSLDALIPEKRAAREAQDNSDFESFFPQPKPVEYPALLLSQVNQPAVPRGDNE